MLWYKETQKKLFEILETSDKGLSRAEVIKRQKEYGLNELSAKGDSLWKVILEPFRNVFVVVLLVAASVSLLTNHALDAVIIFVIIVINAGIFYSQHYATQRVLRSLKKHSESKVLVTRDNKELEVSSIELVPGDIITLREGDRVPADARVIHTDMIQVNEGSLTGESVPVQKHASTLDSDKQVYEQDNMVFQGTYILSGAAKALVVATGSRTEFGKIAELASGAEAKSPVQVKIDRLVTALVKVIAVVVVIVFILALFRGIPTDEALRFVLSLSVSAVPEGLPVALTVIIVLGMRRMAKQKALVRSFKAIEDVGLITTIATDKTGTLTKNKLGIIDQWSPVEGTDVIAAIRHTIDTHTSQSDPLDLAILEGSDKKVAQPDKLYSFDLGLRMSGAYFSHDKTIYIKGSPEHILAKSRLSKEAHHGAESAIHTMASKGYRVIAVASHDVTGAAPDTLEPVGDKLELVGLVAFADELRPDTTPAIRDAHTAGIQVKLITGDHYETAYNIGKTVGLATRPSDVISGDKLPDSDASLAEAVQSHSVFARILPEDKFRILQSLKTTEITAMTGDGVNDVPALANSHVGFAMGSGNDIARDAGDIVLLNDKFATIIKAVAEGRKIYDNIRRMLFYLLTTSLGEAITMIGALVFGLPLPVTAIQILWINLVTDTAMVLPLGLEPAEDGAMKRPPRRPREPLLSRMLISRMAFVGSVMAVTTITAVYLLNRDGYELGYIQTVAFMMLITAQWMNAFNARSEFKSSFTRLRSINKGLIVGLGVAFSMQMVVMFGPLAGPFGIEPVPISVLGFWSGIIMLAVLVAGELHKALYRLKTT